MIETNTLLQDRYLIMHLLGQGGMGAVYKAIDRKFGNTVALKETFYSDNRLREAFALEARLLNRLRHAALPVVTDYFSVGESQQQFLVMQYIPGRDLEQLLTERQEQNQGLFPVASVLRWADQLLDALDYLHSQEPPIIHRDIKPQNLKLTPRGEVILLDFGLAKGSPQSESTRSIRGYTPNYSPLEQIRGTGTDVRSDIYSVGATLYHLLTGAMPADSASRTAAVMMGEADPLAPLNIANPEVTPEIAAAIAIAMSLNPDQRYASAALMRKTLRQVGRSVIAQAAAKTGAQINSHRAPTLTEEEKKSKEGTIVIQLAEGKRLAARAPFGKIEPQFIKQQEVRQPEARQHRVRQPEARRRRPIARPRRRSYLHLLGGVAATCIIAFAIGYFYQEWGYGWAFARKYLPSDAQGAQVNVMSATRSSLDSTHVVESLRYYFEVASETGGLIRETGREPLSDGARFRLHFNPKQSGYLYVIANERSGDRNHGDQAVVTTRVEAGEDFQVPHGDHWFQLDRESEKTPFTVIFSPKRVKALDFLTAALGRSLSDSERKDLEIFRRDASSIAPNIIAARDKEQPAIAVQLPEKYSDYQPVLFAIDINRKR